MLLSSAIRVVQNTPTELTVIIPPDRTGAVALFVMCIVMFLRALAIAGTRKYSAIFVALAACGGLIGAINSWRNHIEISVSRAAGAVTVQKTGFFGQTSQSYPLGEVKAAAVNVGDAGTKQIVLVLTSGETAYIGIYEQRQGYEVAVIAMNEVLTNQNVRAACVGTLTCG
ncbi:hypothetical protein [Granulicella sp. S156]|uniref:hypothetical protein n=1 Tax=Granulicella sp. S156 TaxID=1747224 RepID=UPI00131CF07D|nr:hypothetical protein [Granulicella sp. S156]